MTIAEHFGCPAEYQKFLVSESNQKPFKILPPNEHVF
jgi:hypothetical protein